ncbi:MAG: hypothetical protein AAGI53_03015 [Planctomycetota bacterium]
MVGFSVSVLRAFVAAGVFPAMVVAGCTWGAPSKLYGWAEDVPPPVSPEVVAVGQASVWAGPLPCRAPRDDRWASETVSAPERPELDLGDANQGFVQPRSRTEPEGAARDDAGVFELVRYDDRDAEASIYTLEFRPDDQALRRTMVSFAEAGLVCAEVELVIEIPEEIAAELGRRVLVRYRPAVWFDGTDVRQSPPWSLRLLLDDLVEAEVIGAEPARQRLFRLTDWTSWLYFFRLRTGIAEGWLKLGGDAAQARSIRLRLRADPSRSELVSSQGS